MTEPRSNPDFLAERLDALVPPGRFDAPERDADPLVEAAILIASSPQPEPLSADARLRIRAQVLAAPLPPVRAPFPRPAVRRVTRWGLAASIALIVLFMGLRSPVLASVPGDLLYPLKLGVEQVELGLATSTQERAFVHLAHAERRAQEAWTVAEQGQLPDTLTLQALDEMLTASRLARADTALGTGTLLQLEARSVQVNALIHAALVLADQSDQIPQAAVTDLTQRIQATQTGGGLLLPATPTLLPSPASTLTPEPTLTASPLPTASDVPVTITPSEQTPEVTAVVDSTPATIVVEGPIEAITTGGVIVFGTEISISPDDPALKNLRVGQNVRIEGTMHMQGSVLVIVAIHIQVIEIAITAAPASAPASGGLPSNCKVSKNGKIKCSKKTK
ncbi:MAG: DUF5667 domain-containing protein [Anaerolineae bacterium]|nr:DUF5667 domain-containing protein [Anaerolineae bacterium]